MINKQEVCHRGFVDITKTLVQAGADLLHIPNAQASGGALFMRGAPQSPLGEAARGGFTGVRNKACFLGWGCVCTSVYVNARKVNFVRNFYDSKMPCYVLYVYIPQ